MPTHIEESSPMPFRSRSTISGWLEEFRALGHETSATLSVMQQDGDDGANTGLVGVQLAYAPTIVYIQPEPAPSTTWNVTLEPREQTAVLGAEEIAELAAELAVVAKLCAFLEAKSAAFVGTDET
ncbi:hypothetical protein ABC304_03340 [Microbacterium sp. 1P10UB]|uniref:hypothetical protein n=1 Tax=unclassified Microbacterium TaxID=2609290 RepID=UPI0039A2C97B